MSPTNPLRRHLVHWLSTWKARRLLASAKYVHLIHNDKFAKPFVEFLNRNFPTHEHIVLCKRTSVHPFPAGANVLEVRNFFRGINLDRPNIDKIICHSLLVGQIVDYFYKYPDLQRRKAYWIMWGADLYNAKRDSKNDTVRRNFRGYVNYIDREYALEKYCMRDNFFDLQPYTVFTVPKKILQGQDKRSSIPNVQINNSCDKSTLQILDELRKYAGRIKVTTILSYGSMEWRDSIIAKGRAFFGEMFSPVLDYLNPTQYSEYLRTVDVLVLNQARQQGIGNIAAHLLLGHKVYVRNDSTTYSYLQAKGFPVEDTLIIPRLSLNDLIRYPVSRRDLAIKLSATEFFDESVQKDRFSSFFRNPN